jgi:hypothetical protein
MFVVYTFLNHYALAHLLCCFIFKLSEKNEAVVVTILKMQIEQVAKEYRGKDSAEIEAITKQQECAALKQQQLECANQMFNMVHFLKA